MNKATRELHYYAYDPDHPDRGIGASDITDIIHDRREPALWLAAWSGSGLYRFDNTTETFTHYRADVNDAGSLANDDIGGLYQDTSGLVWVGTRGGGLNAFDPATGEFTRYGSDAGVPSMVNAILEDQGKKLWLSTNNGVMRFNPRLERIERRYTELDGLQGNAFLYESALRAADGGLWFGGTNGVNRFYPDRLTKNPHAPPVVLTALTQGGEAVDWQEGRVPERLTGIELTWRNNFFEFEYAALNYSIPQKNQYKYMLEGLDQDWYVAGAKRTGRYSGLPAGTFTLRIIGSNNDGVWNTDGVALPVTVVPPFWRTLWFRVGAAALLVGGILALLLWRLHASEQQRQKLEVLVRQRTEELYQAKKRAEEAMYETERRFRVIFNQSFQFMGLANPDGIIREFNQTSLKFFQAEETAVTGRPLWDAPWFDLPDERKKIREAVQKAAAGEFVRFETSALAPDGSRVILDFSMKPMWGEFDNIYLLILEGRDLTEYRRTEEALRETLVAKERMESELQIAHDIQMEIIPRTFPPFPDRKEVDIYAMLEPAKEVGGDLYDFFFIDHAHFCFIVGDVSDKGVPAALFMSAAKTLFKAIATRNTTDDDAPVHIPAIDSVAAAVNYELSLNNDSCMFVTAFCGILNVETGDVRYTNAGHNAPLIMRGSGDVAYLEDNRSTLIGADEDAEFTEAVFHMEPGDTLLLYTDGVTEAVNTEKQLFEEDRLRDEALRHVGEDAESCVRGVLDTVLKFSENMPQADDITILALRYDQPETGDKE